MSQILFVQCGGTIDKTYPKTVSGYNFEIGTPSVERILKNIRPGIGFKYRVTTVCAKDSQDMTEADRFLLLQIVKSALEEKVIVTHGTDTLIDSALYLQSHVDQGCLQDKKIIFTGSFLPQVFKESEADFNIGLAIGVLQATGSESGVFVAMNGLVLKPSEATRTDVGQFMQKL